MHLSAGDKLGPYEILAPLADHHRKIVSRGGTSHYLATSNGAGYLVYLNKATLFAVQFDPVKLETRGNAVLVLDDVASNRVLGTASWR